jgi:histidine ammonia-lyase
MEKEGLALINGTQFMSAILSKVAAQVTNILQSSVVLYSFALEIFGANHDLFTEETETFYGQFN